MCECECVSARESERQRETERETERERYFHQGAAANGPELGGGLEGGDWNPCQGQPPSVQV